MQRRWIVLLVLVRSKNQERAHRSKYARNCPWIASHLLAPNTRSSIETRRAHPARPTQGYEGLSATRNSVDLKSYLAVRIFGYLAIDLAMRLFGYSTICLFTNSAIWLFSYSSIRLFSCLPFRAIQQFGYSAFDLAMRLLGYLAIWLFGSGYLGIRLFGCLTMQLFHHLSVLLFSFWPILLIP